MIDLGIEGLGGYQAPSPAGRALGALGYVVMLVVAAVLERLQFKLRATEARTWWASNGRDAINAGALLGMALGLKALGFSGPLALCVAAVLVLVLSLVQTSLEVHRHAGLLSVAAALVLGLPVLAAPEAVHRAFRATLEGLF